MMMDNYTTPRTWMAWRLLYPNHKFIVHNQNADVQEYFPGANPATLLMVPSYDPDREDNVEAGELWFDTFYTPIEEVLLVDLVSGYADERSIDAVDGKVYLRMWWD